MKQILFLLLFPCLAMAQYPGNAGQKITLGEQTTADGLVYRGLAADTTRKPFVDTMAFILLDTNTNIIWQYKKATNNAWTRVGGSISSGLTGVLPVANGGTNTSTAFTAGSVVFAGASGTYTQDNSGLFFNTTSNLLGIGTASPSYALDVIEDNEPSQTNTFAIARFTGSNATANDLNIIGPSGSQVRLNFGRVGRGQDGEMGYNNNTRAFRLVTGGNAAVYFDSLQRSGFNVAGPTAIVHIAAGTTTKPLLRFNTGSLMTTPDAGAFEFNGNLLYFTPSTTRHRIYHGVVNTAVTLDFPSTNAQTSSDLTVTVTGAVLSDVVSLGVPNGAVNANSNFSAWVSDTDIVTVRFNNYSSASINPISGVFKVFVTK